MFGNCEACGNYKALDSYGHCESCSKTEEDLVAVAREYIRRNQKVSMSDLAETLGIDQIRVFRWVQQGRLRATGHREICPDCRQPILKGMFCGCTKYVESITPDGELAKSTGTPRRVQAKWEDYWDRSSRIRRHRHRRIWLVA
ncbi:MAG: hypothetical protein ABIH23_23260 [bacterium]